MSGGGAFFSSLDRYELKYIIPYELVEPISEYLMAYCVLDHHSTISENAFYEVNSLYFDTPNYLFYRNRMNGKNPRFNMRARSYGREPKAPYFLEVKFKDAGVVNKHRATIDDSDWPMILTDPNFIIERNGSHASKDKKELFYRLILKYNAHPKIFTHYRRRAFVSLVDEYARVTMDIGLKYKLESNYTLVPQHEQMTAYDNPNIFVSDGELNRDNGSVILELKCVPTEVPLWMLDLIHHFQLKRTSFSKYVQGVTSLKHDSIFFREHFNFNDRTVNKKVQAIIA
jgi:SPX domain protein involved in polyphosphate accumulation